MFHRTKNEPDGSVTTWESEDGRSWHMTGQTYPEKKLPEPQSGDEDAFSLKQKGDSHEP